MIRIANFRTPVEVPEDELPQRIAGTFRLPPDALHRWRILRKSLDARNRTDLQFVYTICAELPPELEQRLVERFPQITPYLPVPFDDPIPGTRPLEHAPVVIGSGPAGLFAALFLAERGYRPLIIERGQPVKQRVPAVRAFDAGGPHDPENNYLFGEGGAGTFSDGKLTCRLSGPDVDWVLRKFVECGGRPSLVYEARPHLGSNRLPMIVRNLRRRIEAAGGEYRFGCRVERLQIHDGQLTGLHTSSGLIPTRLAVLAIGHSARDTYRALFEQGIAMTRKPFQLGLRIEQPQEQIDRATYGKPHYRDLLGPADYALTARGQRDVYTFCMCAGGYIIPSVSVPERFCTNGMSNSRHDTPFANSGVMVTLQPHEFGSEHPLAGMELQERFEKIAFALGRHDYLVPIQTAQAFLEQRGAEPDRRFACSYKRGHVPAAVAETIPPIVAHALRQGLPLLDRKARGALLPNANLVGPEMRGSSPIRIVRDPASRQSPSCRGLFPVGEGAGFAGGIVSAAVDGLRAARQIVRAFAPLDAR